MNIEIAPFPENKPLPRWFTWLTNNRPLSCGFMIHVTWCIFEFEIALPAILLFRYVRLSDGGYRLLIWFFQRQVCDILKGSK